MRRRVREREPALAALASAAVTGRPPAGPEQRERPPITLREGLALSVSGLCARDGGFSVHAATTAGADDARARESLCKYILRPALAEERLETLDNGMVRLRLKRSFSDGTIAIEMDPLSLLCRLAAAVPPPRRHLVTYAGVSGSRPRFEVADIVRICGEAWIAEQRLTPQQRHAVRAIAVCRTPVLGGHLDECEACGLSRPSYNSCRNRHCPKCHALAQHRWLEARRQRLLPVHHFHVVFTLPQELRPLVLFNRHRLFETLFRSAAATVLALGRDPRCLGAELGVTAVLHTWTRDLSFHPHLHCVVPGAGLDADGRLVSTRPGFLFPVHVLGALFRGKLLAAVEQLYQGGKLELVGPCKPLADRSRWRRLLSSLYDKSSVVYCKPPFGSADAVLSYLGRYTHRIAISNARLLDVTADAVSFRTRYPKSTSLPPRTFLKRFLLHVLPKGFERIRHYGTFAPANVHTRLAATRRALGGCSPPPSPPDCDDAHDTDEADDEPAFFRWLRLLTGIDLRRCPRCHRRAVVRRPLPAPDDAAARAPP